MCLLFTGLPHGPYQSAQVRVAWHIGEVREVRPALAAYLLETFPHAFESLAAEPAHVGSPDASAPSLTLDDLLSQGRLELITSIKIGEADGYLLELSGDTRKSVRNAVAKRAKEIG